MIVKNEEDRILRALDSCAQWIDCWVIADTGSTDSTPEKIEAFFKWHNIPGKLIRCEFKDFSQARNEALRAAKAYARMDPFDYILLMDADMVLEPKAADWVPEPGGAGWDMYQTAGNTVYLNRRLMSPYLSGEYVGVTHEYLDIPATGAVAQDKCMFGDYGDGSNRVRKYVRDIKLLKNGLKTEPNNVRYFFYLAQSYKDAGKFPEAIKWYQRRIDAGGWDEELYFSQLMIGECYKAMGREAEFILNMLRAYNMRPSRVEGLYSLSNYWRHKGNSALACLMAEQGMKIPMSGDALFVNKFAHEVGCAEDFSISAFYVPEKRDQGFEVSDKLSLVPGDYGHVRFQARKNLWYYMKPIADYCPSFKPIKIDWDPPEGWQCMNPSITWHQNSLFLLMRTVNYKMDEDGRYLIGDKAPSDDNPISTRNFLLRIDDDLRVRGSGRELLPPGNLPLHFKAVIGFEDMRLFSVDNKLWQSSTVRQFHADGNCEQVLTSIDHNANIVSVHRMLREPRQTQKNWMPITGRWPITFMYRLGHVVDQNGNDLVVHPCPIDKERISGGSQLIPYEGGWLAVVHEAEMQNDKHWKRWYWHRFVFFKKNFEIDKIGRPFFLEDKQIEFVSGLAVTPGGKELVMSYAVRDCEAKFATIDINEVNRLLWFR
jgi:glycosyltransferase involved in cell wall biosynthesis